MKLLCWFRFGKEKESREIEELMKHQSPPRLNKAFSQEVKSEYVSAIPPGQEKKEFADAGKVCFAFGRKKI